MTTTETEVQNVDANARRENAADLWDRLWSKSSSRDWRAVALRRVYDRIIYYTPEGASVLDFGGGVGALGERLKDDKDADVTVFDHSKKALVQAKARGLGVERCDLEDPISVRTALGIGNSNSANTPLIVASEVLEHLTAGARFEFLDQAADHCTSAIFTVPNNCLGPPGSPGPGPKEPQHSIQFTAITFAAELRQHFERVRVEVFGAYLVGVCGDLAGPATGISMTLPVRDEQADLEAVLASFRGYVDEIVVGIDPRTVDGTRAIAEAYADVVFDLEDPACQEPTNPLHDPAVPESGVHFSWIRNQCIERCSSEWVFMTEGHERLWRGQDVLLHAGRFIEKADVVYVWRRGTNRNRWLFPWLARRSMRYKRSTHNTLDIPNGSPAAVMRNVITLHDRDHGNAVARAKQRGEQNRKTLWDDWEIHGNPTSLFYFAQELKVDEPDHAIERFEEFLQTESKNGAMRYQARLILAKLYLRKAQSEQMRARRIRSKKTEMDPEVSDDFEALAVARMGQMGDALNDCRRILHGCTTDDWNRVEHWMWLGDLAFSNNQFEQAYVFYRYCGTTAGEMPMSVWWIDEGTYLWVPALRLAMCAGHLGREKDALFWAERVLDLLPHDAPEAVFEEARANVIAIGEVIEERKAARDNAA